MVAPDIVKDPVDEPLLAARTLPLFRDAPDGRVDPLVQEFGGVGNGLQPIAELIGLVGPGLQRSGGDQ